MELTYTDTSWADLGLLDVVTSDFAWGVDENDFEIVLAKPSGVPQVGSLVYDESGIIGGIVRGYESEYETDVLRVTGDTWTGVLDCFVLKPPPGSAYYSVSGTMKACVQSLLTRLGVGWLFTVSNATTGITVSHTFKGSRTDSTQGDSGRFMGGWDALWQLVSDNGCKASFAYDASARKVVVTVLAARDWTDAESIDAGVASVNVSNSKPVNHLVCLGAGEGAARTVIDLYADASGNVSGTKTQSGKDEIADVYDFASSDDLTADGTKKLRELWNAAQEVKVAITEDVGIEVGDKVGGTDVKTGVYAEAIITKKVIRQDGASTSVSYESTIRS